MADRFPLLDNKRLLDPRELIQTSSEHNSPDTFWGRANGYTCPRGKMPGSAWLLILGRDLKDLDPNDFHSLKWIDNTFGGNDIEIKNLAIVRSWCMNFSLPAADDAAHLVELQDVRRILFRSSIDEQYNVRVPTPPQPNVPANRYYPESLDAGNLWTWQRLLDNVWSNLGPLAGLPPLLPIAVASTPEDFRFLGVSAWEALHVVLDAIGCTTAMDPKGPTFTYVDRGAVDAATRARLQNLSGVGGANRRMYDADPTQPALANVPAQVEVFFHRNEEYYGIERDTPRASNWEMLPYYRIAVNTNVAGASGTLPVWADLPALVDCRGLIPNAAELQARAEQVRDAIVNEPVPELLRFSGIVNDVSPGSEVTAVTWRDYGDDWGLITQIEQGRGETFFTAAEWNPAQESLRNVDLARKSFPLFPHYKQVVQTLTDSPEAGSVCGQAVYLHSGTVRLLRDGMEVLESCFILIINDFDVKRGNVEVKAGELYLGRLAGVATVASTILPLYLCKESKGVSLVVADECILPGDRNKKYHFAEYKCDGVITPVGPQFDNFDNVLKRTFLLPCEPVYVTSEGDCVVPINEAGLFRKMKVTQTIPCNSVGPALPYGYDCTTPTGNCLTPLSVCGVNVCGGYRPIAPEFGTGGALAEDIRANYDANTNLWIPEIDPMPDVYADVVEDVCCGSTTATISATSVIGHCEWPELIAALQNHVADNRFQIGIPSGLTVRASFNIDRYDILMVQPTCEEIVIEASNANVVDSQTGEIVECKATAKTRLHSVWRDPCDVNVTNTLFNATKFSVVSDTYSEYSQPGTSAECTLITHFETFKTKHFIWSICPPVPDESAGMSTTEVFSLSMFRAVAGLHLHYTENGTTGECTAALAATVCWALAASCGGGEQECENVDLLDLNCEVIGSGCVITFPCPPPEPPQLLELHACIGGCGTFNLEQVDDFPERHAGIYTCADASRIGLAAENNGDGTWTVYLWLPEVGEAATDAPAKGDAGAIDPTAGTIPFSGCLDAASVCAECGTGQGDCTGDEVLVQIAARTTALTCSAGGGGGDFCEEPECIGDPVGGNAATWNVNFSGTQPGVDPFGACDCETEVDGNHLLTFGGCCTNGRCSWCKPNLLITDCHFNNFPNQVYMWLLLEINEDRSATFRIGPAGAISGECPACQEAEPGELAVACRDNAIAARYEIDLIDCSGANNVFTKVLDKLNPCTWPDTIVINRNPL